MQDLKTQINAETDITQFTFISNDPSLTYFNQITH